LLAFSPSLRKIYANRSISKALCFCGRFMFIERGYQPFWDLIHFACEANKTLRQSLHRISVFIYTASFLSRLFKDKKKYCKKKKFRHKLFQAYKNFSLLLLLSQNPEKRKQASHDMQEKFVSRNR
jgi:hypothetical protein